MKLLKYKPKKSERCGDGRRQMVELSFCRLWLSPWPSLFMFDNIVSRRMLRVTKSTIYQFLQMCFFRVFITFVTHNSSLSAGTKEHRCSARTFHDGAYASLRLSVLKSYSICLWILVAVYSEQITVTPVTALDNTSLGRTCMLVCAVSWAFRQVGPWPGLVRANATKLNSYISKLNSL